MKFDSKSFEKIQNSVKSDMNELMDYRLSDLPVKEQVVCAFLFETDFLLTQTFVPLCKSLHTVRTSDYINL